MYFWRTNQLAEDLKNNNVTEREKMRYFLALTIVAMIGFYLTSLNLVLRNNNVSHVSSFVELVIGLLIATIGIRITFYSNKGNQGLDYLARVVCLSLPIIIKIVVITVFFGLTITLAAGRLYQLSPNGLFRSYMLNSNWIFIIINTAASGGGCVDFFI